MIYELKNFVILNYLRKIVAYDDNTPHTLAESDGILPPSVTAFGGFKSSHLLSSVPNVEG